MSKPCHIRCPKCSATKFETQWCRNCNQPMTTAPHPSAEWDKHIDQAVDTIIHCWDEWDGMAQDDAQHEQNPEVWLDFMRDQVRAVVAGLVYDEEPVQSNVVGGESP